MEEEQKYQTADKLIALKRMMSTFDSMKSNTIEFIIFFLQLVHTQVELMDS